MSKSDQVDPNREYTTQEAAELAGVDPSYLRRLLGQKVIKGRNVGGRIWFIAGASLRQWLEMREDKYQ